MRVGATVVFCLLALTSCGTNEELDDLAKAQQCLNEVPQSSPSSANSCFSYVEKYSSQQANILKCSIKLTSGGLMEDKVIQAYKAIDSSQIDDSNEEAAFMAILALDTPDYTTGYTTAVEADTYCQATGLSGLRFLSGAILQGTFLAKTIEGLGGTIDINDPADLSTEVDNLMTACMPDPTTQCPSIVADLPTIGAAAVSMANDYCDNTTADQGVCAAINQAVSSAGGSSNVGVALLCALNHQTYNSGTGQCI